MLERRKEPELVPNYSLTGDLLSFMRCGLQYRYQNGSALPPSRPVQMWFGEFVHGVMETAYRMWLAGPPPFPWPCNPTQFNADPPANRVAHDIGAIGDLVEVTLAAAGKNPRSRNLRDSAYRRAELAVNEIGPALFPLIKSAEEKVIGTRPLLAPPGTTVRAKMYELHGIMDVLSSVTIDAATNNTICDAVRKAVPALAQGTEIIVDYKGSRRPATTDPYWDQGDWQLQMYSWLRAQQHGAAPIAAGVLLYINELDPGVSEIANLQRELRAHETDVRPTSGSNDDYQIRAWRQGNAVPNLSLVFRLQRTIRVVPITPPSVAQALQRFDNVVLSIENCVGQEAQHGTIIAHWPTGGDDSTCAACDFRHFCPSPANVTQPYTPPAPNAP